MTGGAESLLLEDRVERLLPRAVNDPNGDAPSHFGRKDHVVAANVGDEIDHGPDLGFLEVDRDRATRYGLALEVPRGALGLVCTGG